MRNLGTILVGALLCGGLLFATACGNEDAKEAAQAAADATQQAAEQAQQAASDAADAAAAAAAEASEMAKDAADEAAAMTEKAADVVVRCKEAAATQDWKTALEACTKAHEANPDDMAIEHAMQQAEAGAAE